MPCKIECSWDMKTSNRKTIIAVLIKSFAICKTHKSRPKIYISCGHPYLLLLWWHVVDWSPKVPTLAVLRQVSHCNSLEKKYVGFGFMDFIVLPPETLHAYQYRSLIPKASPGTCVMPNALHSSSHNSFKVPFEGS